MRRALAFGSRALRRRTALALLAWSVPEMLAAALSGAAVARAVDAGFLAGRPGTGLAWLAVLVAAAGGAALGTRQVYRRLGGVVEPFRDALVRRVVGAALARGVRGGRDDGAVARLTHQVEIARDTFAGLVMVLREFLATSVGAAVGVFSLAPAVAAVVLPGFVLGVAAFAGTLGLAAARQRAYVRTDEQLSVAAGKVAAGLRDLTACGAEAYAAQAVDRAVAAQAAAERALASMAAVRGLCLALGGWLPLVALLAAGQALVDRGLTAGQLLGGTTYVLAVLQPALSTLVRGLGSGGVRYVITVERLLGPLPGPSPASPPCPPRRPPAAPAPHAGPLLDARGLTFAYGTHAAPVLGGLDLRIEPGGHLAVLGPSGIGKSTLAGLLCGLIRPQAGQVLLDGVPVTALSDSQLADRRVLIPQEAYVFTGSLWENLTYLRPDAAPRRVEEAVRAVGAAQLVARLGGWQARVRPAQLSAGERQLIALVRAYLAPAPLAVLDEATCYLDPPAEARAERAFAARAGALVVIAHRISSALRAPRLLVLDTGGPVVGSHPQVRERSPLYRELLGHWHAGASPRVDRCGREATAEGVGEELRGAPNGR